MEEKLTCYIIDDEFMAHTILKEYIQKVPFLELIGTSFSPLEAAGPIEKDKPDLLLLDINMPDIDGLSFLTMLHYRPLVILTTAYDQYALKAFELEVKDYLVKPFSFERFYRGVLRLYQEQNDRQSVKKEAACLGSEQGFFFLKVGHRMQKIALGDILFIEGMKDYLRIHTVKEKIMTLTSFAKLEVHLPPQNFARVHKSYMVAIDKIEHIEKNRMCIADHVIPISEKYSEHFFSKIKGL